ncbi:MAG: CHAP domain-containing protein [Crocinitomicaceae bacterium]|jgi:surface antigen|nr:CHAP domain-containing protein [Crocinitomicaceae bacterium]
MKLFSALILIFLVLGQSSCNSITKSYKTGDAIDSLNHVTVFYNGGFSNVSGRNVVDGYNIGLRYQCVEFVKRYYFEYYQHRMPNSYGHAKAFFQKGLGDGQTNRDRALTQFTNPSKSKPQIGDLIVFDASISNSFGHVAIVSDVQEDKIEIIQQNTGSSRDEIDLELENEKFRLDNSRILGWLRK